MDRLEFSFKEDSRGQSIKTDVYYSTDTVSSLPRPIVLVLHGGGFVVGSKDFRDPFWSSPLPALSNLPTFDSAFLAKVYEEKDPSSSKSSLERPPPGGGMPRPDLSNPRNGWLFNAIKNGHHIKDVTKDGNTDRIDPVNLFSANFPPTLFIHGNADTLVSFLFSSAAHESLKSLGVETEFVVVGGKNHGFDAYVGEGEDGWDDISKALGFLKEHV